MISQYGVDVVGRLAMVGVSLLHGWPSGIPAFHLFFVFSFEVGKGGGSVAGKAFPFCSFLGEDVCPFVSLDAHVAWNPVDVGFDSPGGYFSFYFIHIAWKPKA